jgi:hypothetical protein
VSIYTGIKSNYCQVTVTLWIRQDFVINGFFKSVLLFMGLQAN